LFFLPLLTLRLASARNNMAAYVLNYNYHDTNREYRMMVTGEPLNMGVKTARTFPISIFLSFWGTGTEPLTGLGASKSKTCVLLIHPLPAPSQQSTRPKASTFSYSSPSFGSQQSPLVV
jgi:hypothetical protein